MENNVLLRALKKEDLPVLEDVIRKTWNYDRFASPKTAGRMARVYLASCLAEQTYTQVAEVDGVPAGIILGKNIEKHRCPARCRLRQMAALGSLCRSKEGRELLGFFKNADEIDEMLLKRCEKDYQGEITLFALSAEYRGLGIGGALFDRLLDYMKKEGLRDFYLYTDTSCNFGFYEHRGMTRRQQCQTVLEMKGQKTGFEFYLYDMAV